jgi:transposase
MIRVGVDVGGKTHHVGIAGPDGKLLDEFSIPHSQEGFQEFFDRVEKQREKLDLPVAVAMEGYNGHARPLDRMIREKGYTLYNVNNLKLARFREIFPGPAKTDSLDVRRILELFHLKDHLPVAKDVLQEVPEVPRENEKLKRLSRRRRQLVLEKVRVMKRMQADLQAVCPELLSLTRKADNLWFLRFLASQDDLRKLAHLKRQDLLRIPGIGRKYAETIGAWQKEARFAPEVEYVGPMIISDAKRILELLEEIAALDRAIEELSRESEIAQRLSTIPGFGVTSVAELAGEIGTLDRFPSEASLALYLGMCPLDRQSGQFHGTKSPKQVNRRAKAAMMVAVAHHIRAVPESRAYYEKKRREGKRHNQAVRALGRHLVRVMWSMLSQKRDYELQEVPCFV